jgi:hypothetical protein
MELRAMRGNGCLSHGTGMIPCAMARPELPVGRTPKGQQHAQLNLKPRDSTCRDDVASISRLLDAEVAHQYRATEKRVPPCRVGVCSLPARVTAPTSA